MKLSDERRIAAPREKVWAGLNDPAVLQKSIPGCEDLEKVSETEFNATVSAKVGPVKAKFKGAVQLSDLNPPESYRISGEGKGGAAGFAKGGATIHLTEDGDGTIMRYEVDADVGGKLAQIGGRLIEGTSKKLAGEFFDNFEAALGATAEMPAEAGTPTHTGDESDEDTPDGGNDGEALVAPEPIHTVSPASSNRTWVIIGAVIVIGAIALTLLK